jgi:hypothetical protein
MICRAAASLGAVLLAGAAMPALAQSIETVNVTAEHRLEDLQTVPMAVSAFQAGDIAGRRIEGVRDIQFATPSVNFTRAPSRQHHAGGHAQSYRRPGQHPAAQGRQSHHHECR